MVESIWRGMPRSSRFSITRATLPMSAGRSASACTMEAVITVSYARMPSAACFSAAVLVMNESSDSGVVSSSTGYVAG